MNTLKIEFTFGIGRDRNQNHLTVEARRFGMGQIKKTAIKLFGGYTIIDTEGGWRNPDGVIVEETGKTLIIYTKEIQSLLLPDKIETMREEIKNALRQEAICIVQTLVNSEIQ